MIRNILKANSTHTNDSWEKPLLSLTIRNITTLGNGLLRLDWDCDRDEENSVGICHLRTSPSIGDTPTIYIYICFSTFMSICPYIILLISISQSIFKFINISFHICRSEFIPIYSFIYHAAYFSHSVSLSLSLNQFINISVHIYLILYLS